MKIDEEVAVGSVFVLADARFCNRRVFQCGQTPGETLTHLGESHTGRKSITSVGIKFDTVAIDRDLDTAPFRVRQTISFVFEVDPRG